ncbi:MAG: septum formation initiator family protein [Bacilli bacterium]|nr:septum formation initiator family protein [Bacilli bacterium]
MPKRRISKASKRRLTFFGTISVVAIVYFIFSLIYNIYTIYNLNLEKKALDNKYIELQAKAEELKIDIDKLNDPEYLADYARENYGYSKPGEYKIQIEEEIEEIKEASEQLEILSISINKNYVILGLSASMLLIFIYILSKGKKKKQKNKK